jgi:uncharacterized membrane protein
LAIAAAAVADFPVVAVVAVVVDFPAAAAASAAAAREEAGDMKHSEFINQLAHDKIVKAIAAAEKKTSGEIRVFISSKKITDAVGTAQAEFNRLGMRQTQHRNAVLIFVAPNSQKFAVIGDAAVHEKCGQKFWDALAAEMSGRFGHADFSHGIILGIQKAGEILAQHFPVQPDDKNELPNQVETD